MSTKIIKDVNNNTVLIAPENVAEIDVADLQNNSSDPFVTSTTVNNYVDGYFNSAEVVTNYDNAELQFNNGEYVASIPLASGSNAGFMSPADVNAIENLNQEVARLQQQGIRLDFNRLSPTAAEVSQFVFNSGYTDSSQYTYIYVIDADNHVWKFVTHCTIDGQWIFNNELSINLTGNFLAEFESNNENFNRFQLDFDSTLGAYKVTYENTNTSTSVDVYDSNSGWYADEYKTITFSQSSSIVKDWLDFLRRNAESEGSYSYGSFRDFGLDTVGKFTNSTLGAIQGANVDGKVYAENDGTGSVKGWDKLVGDFAPLYDNTAIYNVGDIVIYNTQLYKCTTAVTIAEDFDSAKWTAVNVMDEMPVVPAVKEDIGNDSLLSTNLPSYLTEANGRVGGFCIPNTFKVNTEEYTLPWVPGGLMFIYKSVNGALNRAGFLLCGNRDNVFVAPINGGNVLKAEPVYTTLKKVRPYPALPTTNGEYMLNCSVSNGTPTATWKTFGDFVVSDSIAPSYNSTTTYDVGDLCMYNGQLYECIIDVSTPGDFDISHWVDANVMVKMPHISADPITSGVTPTRLKNIKIGSSNYKVSDVGGTAGTRGVRILTSGRNTGANGLGVNWNADSYTSNTYGWAIYFDDIGTYQPYIASIWNGGYSKQSKFVMLPKKDTDDNTIDNSKVYETQIVNGEFVATEKLYGQYQTNDTTGATIELTYEKINDFSLSADKTLTLKTAQTGCTPEYKVYLTVDNASTIDVTLPTNTYKFKTDDSTRATFASSVITLSSGEYEIIIQDDKIKCWCW